MDTPDDAEAAGGRRKSTSDPFTGPPWAARFALSGPGRERRVSEQSRRRRRRQRRVGWILLGAGGLMVIAVAWVVVTGLMARSQLAATQSELTQLRSDIKTGNATDGRVVAADLARHAHRAHQLTSGPAWWIAAEIPGVGAPVRTVRGVSAAADALGSHTLDQLVDISGAIDPTKFTLKDRKIDISSLIQATPTLDSATASALRAQRLLAGLPHHTWLPKVDDSANQVTTELSKLTGSLTTIDKAAHAAPLLLGYTSPQRYFVAFQNEAESRGTGGIPGAFGVMVADHGTVTFTHFENDGYLEGVDSGLNFGSAYDERWQGFDPTSQYLNSNVDPDFRYAGQIWAAMWQKKTGEHIDGAISLDPTALSHLLAVTGPARLTDGTQISSANIVSLTQSTVYTKFPTNETARKAYLLQIARAVDQQILGGASNAKGLYRAAAASASERRLLIWDRDPSTESLLSAGTIGGTIPDTTSAYVGPVIISYSANKLNYYLKSDVTWISRGCGATRNVTVTMKLTNTAPPGLPKYVSQRTDEPDYDVSSGDNIVMLYYVGTSGGRLSGVTVDGSINSIQPGTQGNHPTYTTLAEIPRGRTTTVVLDLVEPANVGAPRTLQQPMVNKPSVSVHLAEC